MDTRAPLLVRLIPRTVRAQSLGLMAAALAITTVFSVSIFSPLFTRQFQQELAKRGDSVLRVLETSTAIRLAASLGDPVQAAPILQEFAGRDEDLLYVALLGPDRAPVVHAPADLSLAGLEELRARRDAQTLHLERPIAASSGGGELDFALGLAPAAEPSRGLGYVVLGMSARRIARVGQLQTVLVVGLTGLLLLAFFLLYTRWLSRRIYRMASAAEGVAAGDLQRTLEDPFHDDLGRLAQALRALIEGSRSMVGQLKGASAALFEASTELIATSQRSSDNATRQSSSVSAMGAGMEQLRGAFKRSQGLVESMVELAHRSQDSSSTGSQAVGQSIAEMKAIRSQVQSIAQAMQGVVERAAEAGAIIETVNEFSEQSSVLAINSGIEAARAGESGRGFAVVARENRKLARQSKDSAERVRTVIGDIDTAIREMAGVIEEGSRRTESGMQIARSSGEAIQKLAEAISASSGSAVQIGAAIREQTAEIDRMFERSKEIDVIAAETAEGIRRIEAAATAMSGLATRMSEIVAGYKT